MFWERHDCAKENERKNIRVELEHIRGGRGKAGHKMDDERHERVEKRERELKVDRGRGK